MLTLCKIVGLGSPYWYRCCMIFNEVEERRLSSLNGSSRGKTEAFEYNSEIPRVSVPQQCRGNVFRSNQPVCRSCNRPVEVVYRNTLIPVWFGHFWLATIWTTCLNQFLGNFEGRMFFAEELRKPFSWKWRGIDTGGIFEEFPSSTRTQLEPRTSTRTIAKLQWGRLLLQAHYEVWSVLRVAYLS